MSKIINKIKKFFVKAYNKVKEWLIKAWVWVKNNKTIVIVSSIAAGALLFFGNYLKLFFLNKKIAGMFHQRDLAEEMKHAAEIDARTGQNKSYVEASIKKVEKNKRKIEALDKKLEDAKVKADDTKEKINEIKSWNDVDRYLGRRK